MMQNMSRSVSTTPRAVLCACFLALSTAAFTPCTAFAQNSGGAPAVKSVGDVKSLLSPTLPADAKEIDAAARGAKAGETITLRGYIPSTPGAFGADTAEFTLVGALPAPGAAPAATIRVLGADSKPIKSTLKNQHGLKEGAEVFVTGTVESTIGTPGAEAIVVRAVSLHVPRSPLPSGFFAEQPAEGARDVSEARKAGGLKAGDQVTLRGRVGGSKEPFVPGRAVFTLVGRGLKACNENPDDNCSKPWDYCCETKQDILANSVSVQLVDAKGQLLRTDVKGRRGIKELSELVIVGKVVSADAKGVVISATGMAVVQ